MCVNVVKFAKNRHELAEPHDTFRDSHPNCIELMKLAVKIENICEWLKFIV